MHFNTLKLRGHYSYFSCACYATCSSACAF